MAQPNVTKGEFDASIKRFDETISNLKENIDTRLTSVEEKIDLRLTSVEGKIDLRFKHMDEKMDMKFDAVVAEMRALRESVGAMKDDVVSYRKEVRADNLSTKNTIYVMIGTSVIGFLAILVAIVLPIWLSLKSP